MTPTQKAIERVRQLLALATSSNEHEAAAAAAAAAKIMEAHRIDEAMLAAAGEGSSDDVFSLGEDNVAARAYKVTVRWYWGLAWSIAVANRCMPHYVLYPNKTKKVAFAGRPSDATAARYMLDALANDVDRLAEAFVESNRIGVFRGRRSLRTIGIEFRLGCAARICQRLEAIAKEAKEEKRQSLRGDVTALVRLDEATRSLDAQNERLAKWLADQNITYKNRRADTKPVTGAFMAGYRAGDTVPLRGGSAVLGEGEA